MPPPHHPHSGSAGGTRYEFLDLLRGIAALLMIEGHAMRALLDWNIRASFAYDIHELFHGLPAPIFIFAAGAAVAITRQHPLAARATPRQGGVKRRDLRLLNVLIIAYALQLSDFSLSRTFLEMTPEKLRTLLNFNVLQCIVVSVLAVRALGALPLAEGRLAGLLLAVTGAVGLLTPLVWSASPQLPMWLSAMLSRQYGSYFPVFPYLGFALGGAAWGLWFRHAVRRDQEAVFLRRTIVGSAMVFVLCTLLAGVPWPGLFADFWWSSPWYLWLRIAALTWMCAYLRRWEMRSRERSSALMAFLALLGRQSFYIYVGHLIVLYGSSYNYNWNMLRKLGNDLTFWPAAAATASLLAVMVLTTIVWDRTKRQQPPWAARMKWGLAAYLTLIFLIS